MTAIGERKEFEGSAFRDFGENLNHGGQVDGPILSNDLGTEEH